MGLQSGVSADADVVSKLDTEDSTVLDSEHNVVSGGEYEPSNRDKPLQPASDTDPCKVAGEIEAKVDTQYSPALPDPKHNFRFSLYASEVPLDNDVFAAIIGNHKDLGEWNVAGALPLYRDGDLHVTHAYIPKSSTGEQILEYKYALVREESGERAILAWEEGGNRVLRGGNLGNGTGTDHVHSWHWV